MAPKNSISIIATHVKNGVYSVQSYSEHVIPEKGTGFYAFYEESFWRRTDKVGTDSSSEDPADPEESEKASGGSGTDQPP